MEPEEKLIIALKMSSHTKMRRVVTQIIHKTNINFFKIGIDIKDNFSLGMEAIMFLEKEFRDDIKIFYDPKYYEIPSVIGASVRNVTENYERLRMLSVSTDSGLKSIKAAVDNNRKKKLVKILAITILSSIDNYEALSLYNRSLADAVIDRAVFAVEAGANAVTCPPIALSALNEYVNLNFDCSPKISIVVPGIRPTWEEVDADDQRSTITPKEAVRLGADYIVMGRSITESTKFSPVEAVKHTIGEIEEALQEEN